MTAYGLPPVLGPLSGSDLEALAVGMATALTAIHGAGIVHRDLKPANVLLSPLGPRVIDFGIARALDAGGGQTSTGQVVGTPDYMAPERFSGGRRARPPTSSPGAAWWSPRRPESRPSPPGTSTRRCTASCTTPPDLGGLDPDLRGPVEAALAKDPVARPTAKDLLAELVGRNDAEDTAKLAGTLRLNLPGLLTPTVRTTDPAERGAGQAPPPLRRRPVVAGGAVAGVLVLAVAAVLGVRALSQGPLAITDVLYRDPFTADGSGWYNAGTGLATAHGYTGDGRYRMRASAPAFRPGVKARAGVPARARACPGLPGLAVRPTRRKAPRRRRAGRCAPRWSVRRDSGRRWRGRWCVHGSLGFPYVQ
ncbi:serine/threonine-protein kinase [Streptosporangium sp. NBC_01756]|uniref:serine/threonine-protein kinase n=1 Tax=Streptosporangium sp. NBC_01756 TaxID=2975950 RepID=UPI002DDC19EA|nr:protein kinase [Streptosporangium sp. NBC_01756]WSC87707.1 protein kinase [Streptosporangium sp. NBC_01756]